MGMHMIEIVGFRCELLSRGMKKVSVRRRGGRRKCLVCL